MRHWLLLLIAAVIVAGIAYTVVWIFTGRDEGLAPVEPDGRAVPLPGTRPLAESDVTALRFDTVPRGYRMAQVDAALRRAAYDLGYKQELIDVLEGEVEALRAGRLDDANALRQARLSALAGADSAARRTPVVESDDLAVAREADHPTDPDGFTGEGRPTPGGDTGAQAGAVRPVTGVGTAAGTGADADTAVAGNDAGAVGDAGTGDVPAGSADVVDRWEPIERSPAIDPPTAIDPEAPVEQTTSGR